MPQADFGWGASKERRGGRSFGADDFGGEAARQIEPAGAAGQGEVAEGFELGEVEGEAVGTAEAAQDAALQGERLRLEKFQLDAVRKVGLRSQNGGDQSVEESIFGGGDLGGFAERLDAAADCSRARARAAARRARDCGENADRGWRRRDEMAGRGSGETPRPADG